MPNQKIGDWDQGQLARFILSIIRQNQSQLPQSVVMPHIESTGKLRVSDRLDLSDQAASDIKDAVTYTIQDILHSRPSVTGSRANTEGALKSLLNELDNLNIINNNTSA